VRRLAALVFCLLAGVAATTGSSRADAPPCGLPAASPLWIDHLDGTVKFWKQVFAKPGLVLATPGGLQPPALRAAGASTVYFDNKLSSRVGTPTTPADPATIVDTANTIYDTAVTVTGCTTPLIAENELWGASLPTPWLEANVVYRSNVLALLTQLAARGAHPYLLVNSRPTTTDVAGDWWRQAAQVADIVREFFPKPVSLAKAGPILASRSLRIQMRTSLSRFTEIGVPASRLGVMLELGSGQAGRNGLQPASAWFQVVKLEVLAARQVAAELALPTVWSWGWATYQALPGDADKPAAACVYLWTRDQGLCDGPGAAGAGFDSSLTAGQLNLPPDVYCDLGSGVTITTALRAQLAELTHDPNTAATAALAWLATRSGTTASRAAVDLAEQTVVDSRFAGDEDAYLAALQGLGTTQDVAREVLADSLRRVALTRAQKVRAPTDDEVEGYYSEHGDLKTRLVAFDVVSDWLSGRSLGYALSDIAPTPVFTLADYREGTVRTLAGPLSFKPLGRTTSLASVPLPLVRPAIEAALTRPARDEAYAAWLKAREQKLLRTAICAADELPPVAPVDLTTAMPFLVLPS
jgi:hypothetical protein